MADISAEIRQLISSEKLKSAIALFSKHLRKKDGDLEIQLDALSARFARLNRESRMGLLTRIDENSERTRITFGLLGLLADAEDVLRSESDSEPLEEAKASTQTSPSKKDLLASISQKEMELKVKELEMLLDKVGFFRKKRLLTADPEQQFQLDKAIEELNSQIDDLKSSFG